MTVTPRKTEYLEAPTFGELFELLERETENQQWYMFNPVFTIRQKVVSQSIMGAEATIEMDDLEICCYCDNVIYPDADAKMAPDDEMVHAACLEGYVRTLD